ncbi:hypothetical protein [Gallibacterium anatis]|uniref:Uncharacterized protein n=1 Tax=Gallibacterium anatis TaxID=750 RepID=A0A0A2Y3B9_9PAST|nr:hypothetical protein [Gallibacterium anatis]KGQ32004.1 hypothetical protein JP32_05790 [Gallibacterium anatis]
MKNLFKLFSAVSLTFTAINAYALTDKIEINITGKKVSENQRCKLTFKNTKNVLAQCIARDMQAHAKAKNSCPSDMTMIGIADDCAFKTRSFSDDAGNIQYFIYNSKGNIINQLNEGEK